MYVSCSRSIASNGSAFSGWFIILIPQSTTVAISLSRASRSSSPCRADNPTHAPPLHASARSGSTAQSPPAPRNVTAPTLPSSPARNWLRESPARFSSFQRDSIDLLQREFLPLPRHRSKLVHSDAKQPRRELRTCRDMYAVSATLLRTSPAPGRPPNACPRASSAPETPARATGTAAPTRRRHSRLRSTGPGR